MTFFSPNYPGMMTIVPLLVELFSLFVGIHTLPVFTVSIYCELSFLGYLLQHVLLEITVVVHMVEDFAVQHKVPAVDDAIDGRLFMKRAGYPFIIDLQHAEP